MACLIPAPLTEANLAKVPLRQSSLPSATPTPAKPTLPTLALGSTSYQPPPTTTHIPSPTTVQGAIAAKERDGAMFSPSLASIITAYEEKGGADTDLLKAILVAKAKEDERLTASDNLRAEQLRAATVLAHHHAYWMAASLQSQYSPTSPISAGSNQSYPPWKVDDRVASPYPSSSSMPYPCPSTFSAPPTHLTSPIYNTSSSSARQSNPIFSAPTPFAPRDNNPQGKRSTSTRDTPESSSFSTKKARKPDGPATHEDVMEALRARIKRNEAGGGGEGQVASPSAPSPPAPRRRKKPIPTTTVISPPPSSLLPFPSSAFERPTFVASSSAFAEKENPQAPPTKRPSPPPRAVAVVAAIRTTSPPSATPYFSAGGGQGESREAGGRGPGSSIRMLLNGGMTSVHANESDLRSVPA